MVEDGLRARYRPYIFYTAADDYRPIGVYDYIQKSELRRNDNEDDDQAVLFANAALHTDPALVLSAHFTTAGTGDRPCVHIAVGAREIEYAVDGKSCARAVAVVEERQGARRGHVNRRTACRQLDSGALKIDRGEQGC